MILARGLAVLAAAGLMSVAAPAQELKSVKIGVVNLSTDVAFYIAEKRGYFKAEGLKADFAYFDSGAKMIVPLGTGALAGRFAVQEKDSTIVTLPLSFSYSGVGAAGRQLMNTGSVNYRVTGDVTVGTPLGNFTRPYDQTGRFSTFSGTK